MALETRLKPTWDWILNVMDATEAQLRFGASLTNSTDSSHPLHPLHLNANQPQATTTTSLSGINVLGGSTQPRTARLIDPASTSHTGSSTRIVGGFSSNPDNQRNFDRENYAQSSRREFLTYALSLMRSHSSEHRDSLPVLDVTALRHIAYVLDGIVFYMRSAKENDSDRTDNNYWADADENENDDTEDELQMSCDNDSLDDDLLSTNGSRHIFFQRSESTLCLGCPPPDPFNSPMNEALPLADQPHLLQPNACREDLFGIPKQPITIPSNNVDPPGLNSPLELPPTRLGLSSSPKNAANAATIAHLASHYESHYSYTESSNEAPATEEQPMSLEGEETKDTVESKSDLADAQTASASIPVVPTAPPSEPLPGTSKDNSSSWRQPDGFNIYMQLKKKTYIDFHDEETKSNNDNDKRNDKRNENLTQDLSNSKSNTDSNSGKMDLDSDHDDLTDSESDGRSLPTSESNVDENQSGRPQIIVTPRKIAAAIDAAKANILVKSEKTPTTESSSSPFNVFASGRTDSAGPSTGNNDGNSLTVIAQSVNTSGSPSKSVIVRAGPSVSFLFTSSNCTPIHGGCSPFLLLIYR